MKLENKIREIGKYIKNQRGAVDDPQNGCADGVDSGDTGRQ